jgi:hypothetical protein
MGLVESQYGLQGGRPHAKYAGTPEKPKKFPKLMIEFPKASPARF